MKWSSNQDAIKDKLKFNMMKYFKTSLGFWYLNCTHENFNCIVDEQILYRINFIYILFKYLVFD